MAPFSDGYEDLQYDNSQYAFHPLTQTICGSARIATINETGTLCHIKTCTAITSKELKKPVMNRQNARLASFQNRGPCTRIAHMEHSQSLAHGQQNLQKTIGQLKILDYSTVELLPTKGYTPTSTGYTPTSTGYTPTRGHQATIKCRVQALSLSHHNLEVHSSNDTIESTPVSQSDTRKPISSLERASACVVRFDRERALTKTDRSTASSSQFGDVERERRGPEKSSLIRYSGTVAWKDSQ